MILLPVELVKPYINEYYLTYRNNAELLGFMPCSEVEDGHSRYYSVTTTKGSRVVPIFFVPDMVFDSDYTTGNKDPQPALFFMGCDDGHMGLTFKSKTAALQWIDDQKVTDFELMLERDTKAYRAGEQTLGFKYHN